MNTYQERLLAALKHADLNQSQLAALVSKLLRITVSPQTIQYLVSPSSKGKGSKYDVTIAQVCQVSSEWLTFGKGSMLAIESNVRPAIESKRRAIPVISKIPAGGAVEIVDAYHAGAGMEELVPDAEVSAYSFGLIIDGDSMQPRFNTGDKVIIDPAVHPRPGDFVAFKCNNGHGEDGSTFKQYRPRGLNVQGQDYFELVPLNENYPTIRSDQVECIICGTMVEHRIYRKPR